MVDIVKGQNPMLNFIFITGTSGIGKSTLAQNLMAHFKSVVIEQHMIPEFLTRDGVEEMTGALEELTCWENTKAMAFCFHRLGYQNIIVSDHDDLRTADVPIDFKGYRFLTLKLVCSDLSQIKKQMQNRGDGLIDFELQEKCNSKLMRRAELPNEYRLDIAGLDADGVLQKALSVLETAEPMTDYEYQKPPKEQFYSWVPANGLR